MKIVESFTLSKTGNNVLNEDAIYFAPPFAAVVDGTTSKDDTLYDGVTGGRLAALVILSTLETLSPDLPPYDILYALDRSLKNQLEIKGYVGTPSAGITLYNNVRRELISYGDNPYVINGQIYSLQKEMDIKAAAKRASVIKAHLSKGMTVDDIRRNDVGREAILEELKYAAKDRANRDVLGGYPVIAGQGIVEKFIKVHSIENDCDIILASDGYPKLFSTLEASEKYLKDMLEKDILCIDELIGTKGVYINNISFDDRSYLHFKA